MQHGDLGNLFNFIINWLHTYICLYVYYIPIKKMYPYTIFKTYTIVDNTMMSHPKHITHSFGSNKGICFLVCSINPTQQWGGSNPMVGG
jgi:hypothetical protein